MRDMTDDDWSLLLYYAENWDESVSTEHDDLHDRTVTRFKLWLERSEVDVQPIKPGRAAAT